MNFTYFDLMTELNAPRKDFRQIELKIALCYPNIYQAGIACYAIQLLYDLFNSFENIQCERFYYSSKTPPISLESSQPLKNFDVICFSLQYELDYINMLNMILSAGIPTQFEKRTPQLIIAGGPCVLENPLPISEFVDIFVLGDLEPILDQLVDNLLEFRKGNKDLNNFLDIPGIYIPRIHQDERIVKLVTPNLDKCYHPVAQLISDQSPFGKSLLLEVTRGCPRGCRFCLIGYQGLPMRYRSLATLKPLIIEGVKHSKVNKVSLIGPSISDYPKLEDLCAFIVEQGLKLSLPSMRFEALSDSFLEILKNAGLRTLSLAPESGSAQLRTAIGKSISDDLLLSSIITCLEAKLENLKLYFLIGLPTETSKDIDAINKLLKTVIEKTYTPQHLHLSINPFIPKPHTPFQWEPPINLSSSQKTIKSLQKSLRKLKIYNVEFLDPRWARIQGCLSRGTQALGAILLNVLENGASLGAWRKITKIFNYSIENSQHFHPALDEPLPWDFIDIKFGKQKLLNLYYHTHG